MNYLAHFYLSRRSQELIVGSWLGDFVKGSDYSQYPAQIQQGIFLHRKIDSFTDSHPAVLGSRRRINNEYRHLKGILIDVFFDHFLATHWSNYSPLSLEDFASQVYLALDSYSDNLPHDAKNILPRMIDNNWLASYADTENIGRALKGISGRLKRPNNLSNGIAELHAHYSGFEQDFNDFFPEVIEESVRICSLA